MNGSGEPESRVRSDSRPLALGNRLGVEVELRTQQSATVDFSVMLISGLTHSAGTVVGQQSPCRFASLQAIAGRAVDSKSVETINRAVRRRRTSSNS